MIQYNMDTIIFLQNNIKILLYKAPIPYVGTGNGELGILNTSEGIHRMPAVAYYTGYVLQNQMWIQGHHAPLPL